MGSNAIHAMSAVLARVAAFEPETVIVDGLEYREALQVVRIEGGVANNVVPDECRLTVNRRFAPSRSIADAEAETARCSPAPTRSRSSARRRRRRPTSTTRSSPSSSARSISRCARSSGWTDVARFASRGVPALNFGPGDPTLAHTAGEHVTRGDVEGCFNVLAHFTGLRRALTPRENRRASGRRSLPSAVMTGTSSSSACSTRARSSTGASVILGGGQLAGPRAGCARARELGAARCLVVATGVGTGPLPDPADAESIVVEVEAPDMMSEMRAVEAILADPPADVVAALDRFDPDRDALVLLASVGSSSMLGDRPGFGARPASWVALEDKTVCDALFDAAGVPRPPSRVVAGVVRGVARRSRRARRRRGHRVGGRRA